MNRTLFGHFFCFVFLLTLSSCTSNTINPSSLHFIDNKTYVLELERIDSLTSRKEVTKSYHRLSMIGTGPIHDSIHAFYEIDENNIVDYETFSLPVETKYLFKMKSDWLLPNFGMSIIDGAHLGVGVELIPEIQIHTWLSTWIVGSNKFGLAITTNPFKPMVIGYGIQKVDAYANGDGCGFDFSCQKVHDSKMLLKHVVDVELNYWRFGIGFKYDYNPKYDLKSYSGSLSFFY